MYNAILQAVKLKHSFFINRKLNEKNVLLKLRASFCKETQIT